MKQAKSVKKENEFIPNKKSIYFPLYLALLEGFEHSGGYEVRWNNKSLPYIQKSWGGKTTFNKNLFKLNRILDTCSMKELGELQFRLSDLLPDDSNTVGIATELFKLQFNKVIKQPYSSLQCVIHNCIKGSDAEDVIINSDYFKKINEYQGNEGTVCTYMWKRK